MPKGLTISIYPDGETVSVSLFLHAIEDLLRVVRDVDYVITKERSPRRWVIEELRSSIPTVTVRPLLSDYSVMETVIHGLEVITTGTDEPPVHFTEQVLDDLKRMRRLFRGRDRARRVTCSLGSHEVVIGENIEEQTDRILRGGYWNLGSLEGTLEAVNLHGNPTFTIWERLNKSPIRCYFPKDRMWKDRVKGLLEKRILVSGRVNYFRNGIPKSITRVMDVEDQTPDTRLPKATFGSIPSPEAAQDSVAFLEKRREKGW